MVVDTGDTRLCHCARRGSEVRIAAIARRDVLGGRRVVHLCARDHRGQVGGKHNSLAGRYGNPGIAEGHGARRRARTGCTDRDRRACRRWSRRPGRGRRLLASSVDVAAGTTFCMTVFVEDTADEIVVPLVDRGDRVRTERERGSSGRLPDRPRRVRCRSGCHCRRTGPYPVAPGADEVMEAVNTTVWPTTDCTDALGHGDRRLRLGHVDGDGRRCGAGGVCRVAAVRGSEEAGHPRPGWRCRGWRWPRHPRRRSPWRAERTRWRT